MNEPVRIPVEPVFVGLDMSLSSTGFCRKQGNGITIDTFKTTPRTCDNDLARLRHIANLCMKGIPADTKMICIEDYFTPANKGQIGSAIKLVALGTIMRLSLLEAGIPFFVVAPGILKKYATGKGSCQKSIIVREVYKKWGIEAKDDNQADATVLSHLAEGLCLPESELVLLPKYQQDVVRRLKDGIVGKSYNLP